MTRMSTKALPSSPTVPELRVVAELLKPITWFPPMWAFSCGVIASGVAFEGHWFTIIVGILLAGQVPGTWGLEYAAILALIAFTVPMVNSVPTLAGALVAGVVAVLAHPLPLKLGLVTAVIVGIAAAMAAELVQERLRTAP
jgi:predicted branched-subunit amino acid permease